MFRTGAGSLLLPFSCTASSLAPSFTRLMTPNSSFGRLISGLKSSPSMQRGKPITIVPLRWRSLILRAVTLSTRRSLNCTIAVGKTRLPCTPARSRFS
ncbi:hypothetical protein Mapa_010620 [Marchantia paleacea]|nr:hypothetical protein Mapa_010620 [Marchantia paleacea]